MILLIIRIKQLGHNMAFNPKIVFGLCNVLNRHAKDINLKTSLENSSQYQIEQWAKRMDLIYRDSSTNWQLIIKDPTKILTNLKSIESLSLSLVYELYQVEPGIQKQLSKGLGNDNFIKFRTEIREKLEALKAPMVSVKFVLDQGLASILTPESIGAIDATIYVWKSSKKQTIIPKILSKNGSLSFFLKDCFKVFEVPSNPDLAYKNWYELTQK